MKALGAVAILRTGTVVDGASRRWRACAPRAAEDRVSGDLFVAVVGLHLGRIAHVVLTLLGGGLSWLFGGSGVVGGGFREWGVFAFVAANGAHV